MTKPPPNPECGVIRIDGEDVPFSIFRTLRRKRTIAYKMERDASVRVAAPLSASSGSVVKVLKRQALWITRARALRKNLLAKHGFIDGSVLPYLGRAYVLRITQGDYARQGCKLKPHVLHVHIQTPTPGPSGLREDVRLEILLWLKKRARIKFKKRLNYWADRMGIRYKSFILARPERRWGSCSADDVIRINWRLIMAPLPVLDYVVAHELSHVRHKDHSPRFWSFLAKTMPDCRARRKILRQMEGSSFMHLEY